MHIPEPSPPTAPAASDGLTPPADMTTEELSLERMQISTSKEPVSTEQLERHIAILRELRSRSAPTGAPRAKKAAPTLDDL